MSFLSFLPPEMTGNVFVSADLHYGHKNIVRGTSSWSNLDMCRPFDTVEEMGDVLVNNINDVVGEDDTYIHAGDLAFGGKNNLIEIRERINCKNFYLILGNHDKHVPDNSFLFSGVYQFLEFRYNYKFIAMFHYPVGAWQRNGKGSIHLHGHSHQSYKPTGKMLDIGVEGNDFKPWKLEDAIAKADSREMFLPDHHDEFTDYG